MKNFIIEIVFYGLALFFLFSACFTIETRINKLEETNKLACLDVVMSGHVLPEYCKQYFTK